uniref:Uncharacterized protein n=1 Tax=Candidatus Kentrum sp. UNK TaxID=2126344 RepID=A0A450ZXW6_9GAMM|nr:MAG: hypothetical protein BECKUNK1418G_GA0071005_100424 [Candidatus Kentron sp. UNK]VFK68504.1 MAG: hypothetical protein BECKUNK1418H_GA0071006_100326 [Candidatus Kentron sp. UNK]
MAEETIQLKDITLFIFRSALQIAPVLRNTSFTLQKYRIMPCRFETKLRQKGMLASACGFLWIPM